MTATIWIVAGVIALVTIVDCILVIWVLSIGEKISAGRQATDRIDAVKVANDVEDQVAKMPDDDVMKEQAKWSRPQ